MVKQVAVRRRYGLTRHEEATMTTAKRRQLDRVNQATLPLGDVPRPERRWTVLDIDNILYSLRTSLLIYEAVERAATGTDLRMDIVQLTMRLCGAAPRSSCVLHAVYAQTNPAIAKVFEDYGWTLCRVSAAGGVSRRDAIKRLAMLGVVLSVNGDRSEESCGSLVDVLGASPHIRVEVHSWLHALHNDFLVCSVDSRAKSASTR